LLFAFVSLPVPTQTPHHAHLTHWILWLPFGVRWSLASVKYQLCPILIVQPWLYFSGTQFPCCQNWNDCKTQWKDLLKMKGGHTCICSLLTCAYLSSVFTFLAFWLQNVPVYKKYHNEILEYQLHPINMHSFFNIKFKATFYFLAILGFELRSLHC
jgi:hypothetical protein